MNDIVKAAKILGACVLIAAGMIGYAIAESSTRFYTQGSMLPVYGTALGLWLLLTAWTGRNPVGWVIYYLNQPAPGKAPPQPNEPPSNG